MSTLSVALDEHVEPSPPAPEPALAASPPAEICEECSGSGVVLDDGSFSGRVGVELPCANCTGGPLAGAYRRHLQWQFQEPVLRLEAQPARSSRWVRRIGADWPEELLAVDHGREHRLVRGAGCAVEARGEHGWIPGQVGSLLDEVSGLVVELGWCDRCMQPLAKLAPVGREADAGPLLEVAGEAVDAIKAAIGGGPGLRFAAGARVSGQFCVVSVEVATARRCEMGSYDPGACRPGSPKVLVCDRPAGVELDYGGDRRWACGLHAVAALENYLAEEEV